MNGTAIDAAGLAPGGVEEISASLRRLLADVFALWVKTKGFHWHVDGRHFRSDHLLFDEQSAQLLSMIDDVAERTRKIGGNTLRSVGDIARMQRLQDCGRQNPSALEMMNELLSDSRQLTASLRAAHETCGKHGDVATASLLENWIDEAERRTWFLSAALAAR
jgi:starvation-inducible DNA-binding protein